MKKNGNGKKDEVIIAKTGQGQAEILFGGHHFGTQDGVVMSCGEFNDRTPAGVHCIINPKHGSLLSQKFGL